MILDDGTRQIFEVTIETDKEVSKDLIDVGSSFSIYPQNTIEDAELVLKQMKWDGSAYIGNKTVKQMLIHDIDLRTEKLKLSKFHSEYDTFLPEDLKSYPHLTFMDYALHSGRL